MKTLPALLFVFSVFRLAIGQVPTDKTIEKSIDSLTALHIEYAEPGCVVLIAKGGQVSYLKAFGSADLELEVPMQSDMVFRIGSVTKQFTAVGVLQLVEQGKLLLRDSIQKYVKDFPSKGHVITVENLLTHTSGIKEYTGIDHPGPYIERWDFTLQFLIDHFKSAPLDFEPGTKYGYSNSGYVLLGRIIEVVTGRKYHQYMEENIIKPAGLTRTFYANENTIIPKRVSGYTRDRGFYENCEYQSISLGYACGDLLSTAEDLLKWNNALLAGRLIKKETLEKAFTPFRLNDGSYITYGYGWFIDNNLGSKCIHHEGQTSGFIAMEKYFPNENIYAAILTNVKSGEDTTDFSDKRFRLFEDIFSLALGKKVVERSKSRAGSIGNLCRNLQGRTPLQKGWHNN